MAVKLRLIVENILIQKCSVFCMFLCQCKDKSTTMKSKYLNLSFPWALGL